MPTIYLSPSTQEGNQYTTGDGVTGDRVTGGSEEYWMNRIADAMEPYLRASGIAFVRNTPQMTAVTSIRQSNAGNYDLHLALHSNAAPEGRYGEVQGTDVYYYPGSVRGERAAEYVVDGLKKIYPDPSKVRALPTVRLGEVRQPKAPSVFIEFAYHDNVEDARWITENINEIAANVVQSLAEYFGLPFLQPEQVRTGTVRTQGGRLNMRAKPTLDGEVITRIPNGASVIVYGQTGNWLVVQYAGKIGYISADYVQLS